MEKKNVLGSLAIVVVIAGAVLRGLFGTAAASAAGAGGNPSTSATTTAAAAAASERHHASEGGDTLDVLATTLSADASPEAIGRALRGALATLGSGTRPSDTRGSGKANARSREAAARLLRTVLTLDAVRADRGVVAAQAWLDGIVANPARPADRGGESKARALATLLARRVPGLVTGVTAGPAAATLDAAAALPLRVEALKQAAAADGIFVRFLIATLPDPVDSYTGWQFDPMLDAIAQAASRSDYLFDRYHFPEGDGAHGRATEAHEDEPGLVMFRRHSDEEKLTEWWSDRLVVMLVHENPSGGIHVPAMVNAIRLAAAWNGNDGVDPIRILGPTFSGSSYSIARALQLASRRLPDSARFWIVSGSATDTANKETIERALAGGTTDRVVFQATVQPDSLLVETLVRHISPLEWSPRTAVLFESNTQYGRGMLERLQEIEARSGNAGREVMQLPFPMNVSRLRSAARADRGNEAWRMPSRFRPLSMQQNGTAVDQIHEFFPDTAASYLELALSGMLQTVRRERFGTVVLMATDPRDKLYLAQQLARNAPDVSLITAESDSLYTHPDYSASLQGALVASTYPLYTGNQRWSYGFQGANERRQFANGSSQGIYNATLALLHYQPDGQAAPGHSDAPPSLLEYGAPGAAADCARGCQPPIWISVVGRDAVWPVRAYPVSRPASDNVPLAYTFTPRVRGAVSAPAASSFVPVSFLVLSVVIAMLTAATAIAVARRGSVRVGGTWTLAAGIAGVALANIFIGVQWFGHLRSEPARLAYAMFVAMAGTVSWLAVATLTTAVRLAARAFADRASVQWDAVAALGLTVAATLWAAASLLTYEWDRAAAGPLVTIGFLTRSMDLGSGVSPTIPVVCLATALVLFAVVEQLRRRSGPAALTQPATVGILQQVMSGSPDVYAARWSVLNRSLLAVPWPLPLMIAGAAVASMLYAFDPIVAPLITIEGPGFGRFVSTALLTMQVLIGLSLLQFVYVWRTLKCLLDRLAWHRMIDAYQRVSPRLFPADLLPAKPRLLELQALVHEARRLAPAGVALLTGGPCIGAAIALAADDETDDPEAAFAAEIQSVNEIHWAESRTWRAIVRVLDRGATPGTEEAELAFVRGPRLVDARTVSAASADGGSANAHENLLAMAVALIVRDALARLGHHLMFIVAAVVLVFCSHTLFPFQARATLQGLGWIYVALTFTAIVTVLVQMRRHEVLSRLGSSSAEGRSNWDAALVLKLAVFALVPLLSLFAAQFPDLGGTALQWIEPVEKALP